MTLTAASPFRLIGFGLGWAVVVGWAGAGPASAADDPLVQAIQAYEDRHYDLAYRYAIEASHKPSPRVETWVLLGELQYLRQELAAAQTTWERALAMDPARTDVRQRLQQLRKELPVEQGLARSDTHPFVIRLAEDQSAVDLTDLRDLLRNVYRLVGQSFDTFPNYPITVIVYTAADFSQMQSAPHRVQGLFDGKIRLPLPAGATATESLQRVLWHEYTHVLVHELTKGRCPIWLNEGLATVEEARVRPFPTQAFRAALSAAGGTPPPAGDGPPPDVVSWGALWQERAYYDPVLTSRYEQAYLIVSYLVRTGGWPQMVRLLRRLGQGTAIQEALRVEYRRDPQELEAEWWSWVRRELGVTRRARG
ncbi:MAG: hypothetical protein HY600_00615 [Candidatus Omnitrophica bacterium]|nr:hypothetical protein [Candidatus Omnitrophota bacterium]